MRLKQTSILGQILDRMFTRHFQVIHIRAKTQAFFSWPLIRALCKKPSKSGVNSRRKRNQDQMTVAQSIPSVQCMSAAFKSETRLP